MDCTSVQCSLYQLSLERMKQRTCSVLRILAIVFARRVLPLPGGPCSKIPLVCSIPICSSTLGGTAMKRQ